MSDIKCPCCRNVMELPDILLVPSNKAGELFDIACPVCGLKTDSYDSPFKAVEAWKNREFANWTETAKEYYKKTRY